MKPNPKAAVRGLFDPPALAGVIPDPMTARMMNRAQVDPAAGLERGIEGSTAALAHADGKSLAGDATWSERAWRFTRSWVLRQPINATFALEDVRVAWEEADNPLPPNNNSWGALGRRLVREKVAVPAGHRNARIKSSNGRVVALYLPWAGREL